MDRIFSIAPMLDWTDRHYRYFARLITRNALLYTEMVTTGAIIHGKGDYLAYNTEEHPLALQLGGSDPEELAYCAQEAQRRGYDEVNLNVGCPSDRVQNGRFGACLMASPGLVADCIKAMRDASSIPITVKTRIGIDHQDSYPFLSRFVSAVGSAGCQVITIHARKAWLAGLSPKENREIPELIYERVYQIKRDFPQLHVSLNGGVTSIKQCEAHLEQLDGVMVGREAYQNPFILSEVDHRIYGDKRPSLDRVEIVERMIPYVEKHLANGGRLGQITRHMLGLFHGLPGARKWRRHLSCEAHRTGAGAEVLVNALKLLN